MLLLALAAICAALGAVGVTAAASQLRQRAATASSGNSKAEQGDGEREGLVEDNAAQAAAPDRVKPQPTAYLAAALVGVTALLAVAGVALWFSVTSSNLPGPGKCTRIPSVAERLKHASRLGGYTHAINTPSSKAQKLFDLGLIEEMNFNQLEAHSAFAAAAVADPACARCWWGVAYALGPGANRAVVAEPQMYPAFSPADFPAAQEAALRSASLARAALDKQPDSKLAQRDLEWGEAVAARFVNGSDRQPARDIAEHTYAVAVSIIATRWNDADAFAIAAETYMNLSPWDYYFLNGTIKPTAAEAERLIQKALALNPDHPLAVHLLIHVAEASSPLRRHAVSAARAEEPASRMLQRAGPWATMGHLLHMPSHTFVRIGRWHDAVLSNIRAYEADLEDTQSCRTPYVPEHNTDMLIYAAIMGGEKQAALEWSVRLRSLQETLHTAAYGDDSREWTHLPLALAAFVEWDAILGLPSPPPTARGMCPGPGAAQYAQAVWHYTRGLAFAAKAAAADTQEHKRQQAALAENELGNFKAAAAKVPEEAVTLPGEAPGIYACDQRKLLAVYDGHLQAGVSLLKGDLPAVESSLRAAAEVEDSMGYMEPPRLYQPVRHCLGAVLAGLGKIEEAEQAFRQDLAEHPDNGRALAGLADALQAQRKTEEAESIRAGPLAAAWKHADGGAAKPCPQFT